MVRNKDFQIHMIRANSDLEMEINTVFDVPHPKKVELGP